MPDLSASVTMQAFSRSVVFEPSYHPGCAAGTISNSPLTLCSPFRQAVALSDSAAYGMDATHTEASVVSPSRRATEKRSAAVLPVSVKHHDFGVKPAGRVTAALILAVRLSRNLPFLP